MKQKGITARQLQTILGFEYVQGVYAWTQGKNAPSIDNLLILAQVFGVQMDDIIMTTMVETEIDACGVPEARLQYLKGNREADDSEGVEVLSA